MANTKSYVTFANKELEDSYANLWTSEHPEDKKLQKSLTLARKKLKKQYQFGEKIQQSKIPPIYKHMFKITNLWKLNLSRDRNVLYSLKGNKIRILDIT